MLLSQIVNIKLITNTYISSTNMPSIISSKLFESSQYFSQVSIYLTKD